jgi:hypothetical protein
MESRKAFRDFKSKGGAEMKRALAIEIERNRKTGERAFSRKA